MNLSNASIATKLWLFIACALGGVLMVAGIGIARGSDILAAGREAVKVSDELIKASTQWSALTENNATRNQAMILSSEAEITSAFKDAVTKTTARISDLQKTIEAGPLTEADRAQMRKIGELRKTVIATRITAVELKADGKGEEALQLLNTLFLPSMDAYLSAQREFVKMQEQRMVGAVAETELRQENNTIGIMVGLGTILCLVCLGTTRLVRSIREPLAHANHLAERISQGDLSSQLSTHRTDEFGSLLNTLGKMNASLAKMVSQVRSNAEGIATASAEIAAGNNDLSHRTELASSNLQSTASSMQQLTGTVQQTSGNARHASTLATGASVVAERGGEVVRQVVTTMNEINANSKRISEIVSVIDGIAFQTNILALNAAVEAARAGEQGRGFAVVASEVRSLAQRSAGAAKEIKDLISTSVERVESGALLVANAGSTMEEIVQSVRKVADVIGEITSATAEQSTGLAHVNLSVSDLDQMTRQNAALVEQSAAAADSLRVQSEQLAQAVAVFKIKPSPAESAPQAARRPGPRNIAVAAHHPMLARLSDAR